MGAENFFGWESLDFKEKKKGGSVVTENPSGGSMKTLEAFRGGTTQICLENEDMVGGIAKVIKCY